MRGARCGPGGRRARRATAAQAACMHGKVPTQGLGPDHARLAHVEHLFHGCDLGRVEAQWLVEGHRLLPSRKERAYEVGRGAGREAGGGVGRLRRKRLGGWGGRARAERTQNMLFMFVTLDVSKLSGWLNADMPFPVGNKAYDAGRGEARVAGGYGRWWRKRHARGGPD